MFCLVRTSQEAKPQNGISFLLLRMDTPGVVVRPLPTLDGPPDGQQEVNQVFFENVRVPVAQRIGEEGKGWTYAKYLLEFERGIAYAPVLMNALKKVRRIASVEAADGGGRLIDDPEFRRKLADMQIKVETLNATELRIFASRSSGASVGSASSMLKLEGSETQQAITQLALEAVGTYAAPFVRHLGRNARRDQRAASRPRLRRPRGAGLFQLSQGLDLRRLQRDPEEHHGQAGAGALNPRAFPFGRAGAGVGEGVAVFCCAATS